MLLSDFHYHLPADRIAQEPAVPRDSARLMLIDRAKGSISHHHITDMPSLLPSDYFIVANNTKVFPARLLGHKSTGGKVEILLTSPLGHSSYHCIARPGLKIKDVIVFPVPRGLSSTGDVANGQVGTPKVGGESSSDLTATVTHLSGIERTIRFNQEESLLRSTLSTIGTMPTPPYIKKLLGNSSDYQTIYAKYGFSAAAPTAGLHFTNELLAKIKRDHSWHELTLNVGLGTFLPVKADKVEDHVMHAESYTISPSTAKALNIQRTDPCKKLLAIGTTTMRALEANVAQCHGVTAGAYATSIFIYPPYHFRQVDALLTNFHLPGSTLLMLVSAFCSYPNTKAKFTTFGDSLLGRAYASAVEHNYSFFSFGDAMLII